MNHFPTLSRDGAAYISLCDCDWRSQNTWSWSEALAEYEAHADGRAFPVVPAAPQSLQPKPTTAPSGRQRWRTYLDT